jgi:alkaline phosphatase D
MSKYVYQVPHKRLLFIIPLVLCSSCFSWAQADVYNSPWDRQYDRPWVGREYWANPMQDWRINNGRLECLNLGSDRNVHSLIHQLTDQSGSFRMSVRLGLVEQGKVGSAGFRVGVHDLINDYRGNLFWGKGVDAEISIDGTVRLDQQKIKVEYLPLEDMILTLDAQPAAGAQYTLTLTVTNPITDTVVATVRTDVAADRLLGNLSLVNNFQRKIKKNTGSRFWFADWSMSGNKIKTNKKQAFGPILWSMYTLSNSRSNNGYVMKMTAQMPPLCPLENQAVELQVQTNNTWETIRQETIDADARTATFKITDWDKTRNHPYRLRYTLREKSGVAKDYYWSGTICKEPVNRPLTLAAMTCQHYAAFPYTPVARNIKAMNPDLLYFSGDQFYEVNGHYWIIREPVDASILCYFGKYFMFGMAFGDLMRDCPTLCTPDDHDVFQPNIWGNGGNAIPYKDHDAGGYVQDPRWINTVHRTQTAHHPDLPEPTPIEQGISVFYGDMVYGRISFGIVSDRMFKSGPKGTVCDWKGRADLLKDTNYDVSKLDKPGLKLLGDRQIQFLEKWAQDWSGADMKVVLSQSAFSQILTHSGSRNAYYQGDLDAHGWPQSARNRAVATMRKCFPIHISGDQHLPTLAQYGINQQRDSCWSIGTPAISVGWQRWWVPDEMGWPAPQNRPAHNLPNTGEYLDGVGNKIYVYAVNNPDPNKARHENRYVQAHNKVSGFAVVQMDQEERTYTCAAYRFLFDPSDNDNKAGLFDGYPYTIKQRDNYARKPYGYLKEVTFKGTERPVIKVFDEKQELVYALRLHTNRVRPWVFAPGLYTVVIGDPDKDTWQTYKDQEIIP